MSDVRAVLEDLLAEQDDLDAIVAAVAPEAWRLATPSPGWTVADQIGHLTYFDAAAVQAIGDPVGFGEAATALMEAWDRVDELTLHRHLEPDGLLDAWRANRARLATAAGKLGDDQRVVWYGPSMSARSFLTARLMETWAHGQDVVDAVGAARQPTDRLRHVAQLGVITRRWTYANRGLDVPDGDVRVELVGPGGDVWQWGPGDAPNVVGGPALDFCLVVTQRRNVDDTDLDVRGDAARDWLDKAQAFAGPPTDGPPAGGAR